MKVSANFPLYEVEQSQVATQYGYGTRITSKYIPYVKKLGILLTALLSSLTAPKSVFAIELDHSNLAEFGTSFSVDVSKNEYITLDVLNTCSATEIEASGYKEQIPDVVESAADRSQEQSNNNLDACSVIREVGAQKIKEIRGDSCVVVKKKTFRIPHEEQYTGYLVKLKISDKKSSLKGFTKEQLVSTESLVNSIVSTSCEKEMVPQKVKITLTKERLAKNPDNAELEATLLSQLAEKEQIEAGIKKKIDEAIGSAKYSKLNNVDVIIDVNKSGWKTSFSGGVIVSDLTDAIYSVREVESQNTIVRLSSLEDDHRLVLGAFTHVYHSSWEHAIFSTVTPAVTAGISVNDGSSLDYFVGPSFFFGAAVINVGYHWGKVNRLSSDLFVGQNIDTDSGEASNLFSDENMTEKSKRGFFISVSFTFAGQGTQPIKQKLAFPEPTPSEEEKK